MLLTVLTSGERDEMWYSTHKAHSLIAGNAISAKHPLYFYTDMIPRPKQSRPAKLMKPGLL